MPNLSKHLPYELDGTRWTGFYENYWKQVALDLLLKHCTATGKTVLDYGSGRGETLEIFGRAGFRVTGADIDAECVRLSARFGTACRLEGEHPVRQFGEKSFDIVTCFHVLEHVENPKQTLIELRQISREFVLLAVPNLRYLHQIFKRRIDLSFVNEGHLQSWDHWHLLNLAERHCGLKLVEWGFDATRLPGLTGLSLKLFGARATIKLETGLFKRMFPFHGISIIGLFHV